ncbi:MAG: hypothetical protein M9897_01915 [Brumimicrobium sp.]|nr:hypothetical protein [Brumimicrobium sp.]
MRLYILLGFILFTTLTFAQSEDPKVANEKRMEALTELIQEAYLKEDYSLAAKLKKELDLRKEMAVAFEDNNYGYLATLKKNIEDLYKEPKEEKSAVADAQKNSPPTPIKPKKVYPYKNFVKYFDFVPFSYISTRYIDSYNDMIYLDGYSPQPYVPQEFHSEVVGGGFRMGGSVFFGKMTPERKFYAGLDIQYVSATVGFNMENMNKSAVLLGIGQLGPIIRYHLTENSGIDFRLNTGMSFLFADTNHEFASFGVRNRFSYWIGHFSIGCEYQFAGGNLGMKSNYKSQAHQIGLNCGFYF